MYGSAARRNGGSVEAAAAARGPSTTAGGAATAPTAAMGSGPVPDGGSGGPQPPHPHPSSSADVSLQEIAARNQQRMAQLGIKSNMKTAEYALMLMMSAVGDLATLSYRAKADLSAFEQEEVYTVLGKLTVCLATLGEVHGVPLGEAALRTIDLQIARWSDGVARPLSSIPRTTTAGHPQAAHLPSTAGAVAPPPVQQPSPVPEPEPSSGRSAASPKSPAADGTGGMALNDGAVSNGPSRSFELLLSPRSTQDFFTHLNHVSKYPPEEFERLSLTWIMPREDGQVLEVIPDGRFHQVTYDQFPVYFDMVKKYRYLTVFGSPESSTSPPHSSRHTQEPPQSTLAPHSPLHSIDMDDMLFSPSSRGYSYSGAGGGSGFSGLVPRQDLQPVASSTGGIQDAKAAGAAMVKESKPFGVAYNNAHGYTAPQPQPAPQNAVSGVPAVLISGAHMHHQHHHDHHHQPPPQQQQAAFAERERDFAEKVSCLQRNEVPRHHIASLNLTFCVPRRGEEIELLPNGKNVAVNADNADRFLHMLNELPTEVRIRPISSVKALTVSGGVTYDRGSEKPLCSPTHNDAGLMAPLDVSGPKTYIIDYNHPRVTLPTIYTNPNPTPPPQSQRVRYDERKPAAYDKYLSLVLLPDGGLAWLSFFEEVQRDESTLARYYVTFCMPAALALKPTAEERQRGYREFFHNGHQCRVAPSDQRMFVDSVESSRRS